MSLQTECSSLLRRNEGNRVLTFHQNPIPEDAHHRLARVPGSVPQQEDQFGARGRTHSDVRVLRLHSTEGREPFIQLASRIRS